MARPQNSRRIAAAVLVGSMLSAGCGKGSGDANQTAQGQDSTSRRPVPVRVTFHEAYANPELRQRYLDERAPEWSNGCFDEFIYDHTGHKEVAELKARMEAFEKAGLGHLLDRKKIEKAIINNPKDPHRFASTVNLEAEFARGNERVRIFVFKRAFERLALAGYSDKEMRNLLAVHEGTHACDIRHGLVIDGRRFSGEELYNEKALVSIAVEVRAYGEQLRGWDWKGAGPYWRTTLFEFMKNFDLLIIEELKRSKGWKDFDGRIPTRDEAIRRLKEVSRATDPVDFFIMRRTVLGHEDVIRKLMEKRAVPWRLRQVSAVRDDQVVIDLKIFK